MLEYYEMHEWNRTTEEKQVIVYGQKQYEIQILQNMLYDFSNIDEQDVKIWKHMLKSVDVVQKSIMFNWVL